MQIVQIMQALGLRKYACYVNYAKCVDYANYASTWVNTPVEPKQPANVGAS